MATRFYLGTANTSGVTYTPDALWDAGTATANVLDTVKDNSAMADVVSAADTTATTPWDILCGVWISSSLSAQTISGTFSTVLRTRESNSAADAFLQVAIHIVDSSGGNRRTLFAGSTQTTVTPTGGAENQECVVGTAATRIKNALALTSQTASSGDRLVVEVGARFINSVTTSYTSTPRFGAPTGSTDLVLTAATTTDDCPWIELSGTVTFGGSSLTADAAVTATGTITPTAFVNRSAAAAVTETATITTTAALSRLADAAVSATAAITATAAVTRPATAAVTATATITPTAALTLPAAASVAATATITAAATLGGVKTADAAVAATATITATATPTRVIAGTVDATATLAATAIVARVGDAALAATASITPTATLDLRPTAALIATATITAAADVFNGSAKPGRMALTDTRPRMALTDQPTGRMTITTA